METLGADSCEYGLTQCLVCGESCTFAAGQTVYCGNGVPTEGDEECDEGVETNECTDTCRIPFVAMNR